MAESSVLSGAVWRFSLFAGVSLFVYAQKDRQKRRGDRGMDKQMESSGIYGNSGFVYVIDWNRLFFRCRFLGKADGRILSDDQWILKVKF